MKKVLFATTALVATAGVAQADITITGGGNAGVRDTGVAGQDPFVHTELDFNVVGTTTTDGGVTVSASIDLDSEQSGPAAADTNSIGDAEVSVSGTFGTVSFGNLDPANDFGMSDIGFDGIGIDNVAEVDLNSSADMSYAYSFGDFGVTISGNSVNDDMAVAFNYAVAGADITLGYGKEDATGDETTQLLVKYGISDVSLQLFIQQVSVATGNDTDSYGLHAAYAVNDALTLSAAYASSETGTVETDAFGVGFSYGLGGGVSVAGGVGENAADNTVMDLGINFSF
ncbi:porin [Rhodophyticola sp. SM2404]